MKRTAVLGGAMILVGALAFGAGGTASWHDQLMEMEYHIVHISSINVINGLNLSREQAVKLRDMAREVEKAGAYIPSMKSEMTGDLAEVRRTYVELASVLAGGKEVSPELEKRVLQAREMESRVIRDSISERPTPQDRGLCLSCHLSPQRVSEIRKSKGTDTGAALSGPGLYSTPERHRATDMAHLEGNLGKGGITKAAKLAPQVDALLTDAQKQVLGDFACCLVPPKNLSDPVRAGQADVTDKKLQLLRQVRQVPPGRWDQARERLITKLVELRTVKKTGATEEQLTEYRRNLADVLEKTRRLSDTEFEMKKESLCAELDQRKIQTSSSARERTFKQSYFLLMPGSAKVYDALLSRMGKQDR